MQFGVLSASDPAHCKKWAELVAMLPPPLRDVFFSPDWAVAQLALGLDARLAFCRLDGYVLLQPFALRPIEDSGRAEYDISSLTGYGGPVTNHGAPLHVNFSDEFRAWCRDHKVISEFCLLNPMILHHQRHTLGPRAKVENIREVVVMDLAGEPMEGYHRRRFQGLHAAEKAGVKVRRANNPLEFIRLYRTAMERKRAARRWRYNEEQLAALCCVGTVFEACVGDVVECAALVLGGAGRGRVAYYHLAASAGIHLKVGANDALVHEIAAWARSEGLTRLHLGGGLTAAEDDQLMFFKAGFSDVRAKVGCYFSVIDRARYDELCHRKIERERGQPGRTFPPDFTPLYRREALA